MSVDSNDIPAPKAPSLPTRAKHQAQLLSAQGDEESAALLVDLAEQYERIRRQLVRLGFDLHDGPLQALAAAAADMRHFQSQLESVLSKVEHGDKIVNRIDDLVARTLDLSEQVRHLIIGTDADPATTALLSTVFSGLAGTYDSFALHVSVDPAVDELPLSDSQRICIVRVVRGALDNVSQHSGAQNATVTLGTYEGGVEVEIVDDGSGFDPSRTRDRSIGLVAMEGRVRMLDGTLTINSRPNGPTSVRVVLPAWRGPDDNFS